MRRSWRQRAIVAGGVLAAAMLLTSELVRGPGKPAPRREAAPAPIPTQLELPPGTPDGESAVRALALRTPSLLETPPVATPPAADSLGLFAAPARSAARPRPVTEPAAFALLLAAAGVIMAQSRRLARPSQVQ
jgi:hypothetical protein